MPIPQFKVNVTHGGVSTDYINNVFSQIQIKRRENKYDVATLWFADAESHYYEDYFSKFDEIKIWFKDASELSWTTAPQFGGNIRQIIPTMNQMGFLPQLICKGYGAALEETHCNRDYGHESSWPTLDHLYEICRDLVDNFINKSFGVANTGYIIEKDKIADLYNTIDIKYINNPYRTNIEVIDLICQLTSAIGGSFTPPTAGAHWIVDNSVPKPRLIINQIGNHGAIEWPDWWNTDPDDDDAISRVLSTLTQGLDFTEFTLPDKSEEFANNVVLITDFRRPAYDYWTDGADCDDLWDKSATGLIAPNDTIKIVGTHSLEIYTAGITTCTAWFPKNANAAWDITKWGSEKTLPTLNFYFNKKDANVLGASTGVMLFTDRGTNYFMENKSWDEENGKWIGKTLPIGVNWESAQDDTANWISIGDPSWESINGIEFQLTTSPAHSHLYIDDLHFTGKITRSAKNSWSILGNADPPVTAKKECQKVLISRNAMDDSCVAGVGVGKDDGFAARIAYAELLRRQKKPKTIIFSTTRDMKNAMAGQKIHVHVCRRPDGSFRSTNWDNGGDMRIVELQEDLSAGGILYTVTATTDLLNSTPTSVPDQYAMWQENMFLNSKEAKNIRAGSEVDLLIPILESEYNSDDD